MPLGAARFGLSGTADLGTLQLIQTQSHSTDVSSIDFTSIKESEYDTHLLTINNLTAGASLGIAGIQFYEAGVLETSTVYEYAYWYITSGGSSSEVRNNTNATLIPFQNQSSANVTNAWLWFGDLGLSNQIKNMFFHQVGDVSGTFSTYNGGGVLPQQSVVDGIRITNTGAVNFTDYDISLYGLVKA
jgi:hypothetical protein